MKTAGSLIRSVPVVVVAGGLALLWGCAATGEAQPKTWVGTQGASYCWQSASVTVTVPEGLTGTIEFKDKDGNPITPRSQIDGGVTIEIPVPVGGVAFDWEVGPEQDESSGPWPGSTRGLALAPPPFTTGMSSPAAPLGHPLPSKFSMGCMTGVFDPSKVNFLYALSALSTSEDEAFEAMWEVLDGQVGTPVPPLVRVDAYLELTVSQGTVQMVSALPVEFATYTMYLGGLTVADLQTGLNATVTHGPNGWVSITSTLPLSAIENAGALHLIQQAVGSAEPCTLKIA